MAQSIQKVCIIGAGPNGLMTARHVSECPNTDVTIFESNSEVGGLWIYDEKNEADPKFEAEKKNDTYYQLNNYFHASLYPYLQSNLPYFFMAFKDLSHADVIPDVPVFIDIAQHKTYLNAYADKFDLKNKIVFSTLVKSVRLYDNLSPEIQDGILEKRKFVVTTVNSRGGDLNASVRVHSFDYVLVCTGHNSMPHIPQVENIERFQGKVMTAKSFREPTSEFFIDKKIMVVGTSYSAIDIIVQLFDNPYVGSQNLKHLTLVGRDIKHIQTSDDFAKYRTSGRLSVVPGEIKEIVGPNTIKLTDQSEHEIDTLVFCTGYELHFPFLDFEKDRMVDFQKKSFSGKLIAPLYKRMISIREPCLLFIAIVDYTPIGSFICESQGLIAKAIIVGKYKLPSRNEMFQSFLNDIDDLQWNHNISATWLFKFLPMKIDLKYFEDLNSVLRNIYPHDEKLSKEFYDAVMETSKKMLEFMSSGNVISYKKFDFHKTFNRSIKSTTEFI